MFELSNKKLVCLNKKNFLDYIKDKNSVQLEQNIVLMKQALDYIKKYSKISVWSINRSGEIDRQAYILDKKSYITKLVTDSKDAICRDLDKVGGRQLLVYKDFVVKTDDWNELSKELEIYDKLINPAVQNHFSEHFILALSKGTCGNKSWIALEKEGENMYDFLKKNKIGNNEYLSLILQCLFAYDFLLSLGFAHGDFKPQNVLISNYNSDIINYGDIRIPSFGKIAKLIDFGLTIPSRKIIYIRDMNRFFTLLLEIHPDEQTKNILFYVKREDDSTPRKSLQNLIQILLK
jgi:serine/threonine protein kinase